MAWLIFWALRYCESGKRIWLVTLFGNVLMIYHAHASDSLINYQIPAQSLPSALIQFGADSKLELIFSAELVEGLDSQTLQGEMAPQQALKQLLQGTELDYQFLDADTVILLPRKSKPEKIDAQLPVFTLEPLIVQGKFDTIESTNTPSADDSQDASEHSYQVNHLSTATRTDTPVKQIPQSVHIVNRAVMDDQQSLTLSEALSNISGVTPRNAMFSPVSEGTLIRGFRAEQLLDGFTQFYNPGDRESTVNVERIEVLKGSNAVLYTGGAGSPVGGVINLVSKLPQPNAFASVGMKFGSYDFYQPSFDWNQPLNDQVLFRISGEYTTAANYVDVINTERYNINPSLQISDNNRTTLTLQGKISRWRQPEYQGLPAVGTVAGEFELPRQTFIGNPEIAPSHSESDAVWGSLEHKLNETWIANLKARYATSKFLEKTQTLIGENFTLSADQPFAEPSSWLLSNGELLDEQQELSFIANLMGKFNFTGIDNTLLLGLDHSVLDDSGYLDVGFPFGTVDLASPRFETPYQSPGPGIKNQWVKNTTYGGYVQLQSDYKKYHQLLALRLGGVEVDYANDLTGEQFLTENLAFLPRLGGVLDITQQFSVFANYSVGMRGQPLVMFADRPEPALSTSIEAGLKFDVAEQLNGQFAVYQIERSQVAVPTELYGNRYTTTGQQRSRGFETDLTWRPMAELNFLASYAYTDAHFSEPAPGIDVGNDIAWVPHNAGRLWANYAFTDSTLQGLSMGFGVYLRDSVFVSHDNLFKTAGYHSFDATIGYDTKRFKVAISAKNLTNEDYFQPLGYFIDSSLGGGRVGPSSRSIFLSATLRF